MPAAALCLVCRPNLQRQMGELVEDGSELVVTDPAYTSSQALLLDVTFAA